MIKDRETEGARTGKPDLANLARRRLQRPASDPAIRFGSEWIAAGELSSISRKIDRSLNESGLSAREPVVLVPRNTPWSIAALFSLLASERDIVLVHPYQSAEALAQAIGRTSARAIVAEAQDFLPPVKEVLRAKGMLAIGVAGNGAAPVAGLEKPRGEPLPPHGAEPYFMVQTSGTTGTPKHCPLPYRLFEPATLGSSLPDSDAATQTMPALVYYPLANLSGLMNVTMSFASGAPLILLDRFDIEEWRKYIVTYRPAQTSLPPVGFKMVLNADIPPEDLASLKAIITGSAPVPPDVHRTFEERYGVSILLGYGATEFAGSAASMTAELHSEWGARKFGSVGRAIEGATLRIVDPERFEPVEAGTEGLIEVLMPRVSADWMRTADLGVLDEDDFLFIHGRADGAIMRGGFKILPESIENILQKHPKVAAAAVLAKKDDRLGQIPVAAIELAEGGANVSGQELEAYLRQNMPATHIPTEYHIIDKLPRTGSLKIARAELKKRLNIE